jgi:ribosomal protein S18 acetylase RimI-like enzyme
MIVRPYESDDENAVIELWNKCNLTKPWNNPQLDIERVLKVYPELFLVGLIDGHLVATVIGGYDGHRGWVYYLGVVPEYQRRGLGRVMMDAIEKKISALGCPKINLMVRTTNDGAGTFYEKIGYQREEVFEMGKRLIED